MQAALQNALWAACEHLLMNHTNPWELDEALCARGWSLGPCEAQDLVGLDTVLARQNGQTVTPILPRMVSEGRLGKKGGWGFYRYPGGGGAVIDPLIEDLIREEAWFAKHERHDLSDEDLCAMVAKAVQNAVASQLAQGNTPEDVRSNAIGALHCPGDILGL